MSAETKKIGKYEILEEIGRGGMGAVYRAYDAFIDREVAIKVILEMGLQIPEIKSRFYREARTAGKLSHENITIVHDVGEADGMPYIVMEYLTGSDLRSMLDRRVPMSLATKINYAIQICRGLAYSHSKDVIHRDIKPPNIRILDDGKVKIMDFGIAKPGASNLTSPGAVMGTPYYMSPEQIRGQKVDKRSDMFSFGVLFYELLTLKLPFTGDEPTTVMYKIVHEEPEPIQDVGDVYPPRLKEIVEKTLKKNPDDRYQDFSDVARDLEEVLRSVQSDDRRQHEEKKRKAAELIVEGEKALREGKVRRAFELAEQAGAADEKNRGVADLLRRIEEFESGAKKRKQADEKVARAGSLIRSKQFEESIAVLKEALAIDPGHGEAARLLQSAEDGVRAESNRKKAAGLIAQAWADVEASALDSAEKNLSEALALDPEQPDAGKLQKSIRAKRSEQEKKKARLEDQLRTARKYINDEKWSQAVSTLREILNNEPHHDEARRLLRRAEEAQKSAEARKAEDARRSEEARKAQEEKGGGRNETVILQQPAADPMFVPPAADRQGRVERAPRAHEAPPRKQQHVAPEAKPAGARTFSKKPLILIAAVVVFAVLIAVYKLFIAAPGTEVGYVSLNVLPWADVTRIEYESGGDVPIEGDLQTPCRLKLREGTYKVTCTNPGFPKPMIVKVTVHADQTQSVTERMPDFDPATVLSQF
jgi:serine/threonine protein kinase